MKFGTANKSIKSRLLGLSVKCPRHREYLIPGKLGVTVKIFPSVKRLFPLGLGFTSSAPDRLAMDKYLTRDPAEKRRRDSQAETLRADRQKEEDASPVNDEFELFAYDRQPGPGPQCETLQI